MQVQKKGGNYLSGQRLYQMGDIWVDLEKMGQTSRCSWQRLRAREETETRIQEHHSPPPTPALCHSQKLLTRHWVTAPQGLSKYWLIKMLKTESKRPYGLRGSSKYLQPTWHFLAKLRRRRKKRDAQVARWAKSAPPKRRAESQCTRSPSYARAGGYGDEEMGEGVCTQSPREPVTRTPLGHLPHGLQQPGPNKGPSVAVIHTSLHCDPWLITPRSKRMLTLVSYRSLI